VVSVDNFTYGLLNPALAYAMSCVGGYLGLRCVTLARAYTRMARARWLCLAAVAIGAVGIWAMHFIAMLGFTVPGEPILYNVPLTVGSMLLAVAVVGAGLFIVGFGDAEGSGRRARLVAGGVIVGVGVAAMHYMGMSAMSMPGSMSYDTPLVVLSVVIAIVAGTTALWIGTWVRGSAATVGAALVMGVAVCGMHYTGMAALRVQAVPGLTVSTSDTATAGGFLLPLILGLSSIGFIFSAVIALSPTAAEIVAEDEVMKRIGQSQAARYEPQAVQASQAHPARRGQGFPPGQDEPGSLFRPHRPKDQP